MDQYQKKLKTAGFTLNQKALSPVEQPTSRLDVAALVCLAAVMSLYLFS